MMVACAVVWRERRFARPFSDGALCHALSRALGIHGPVEVLETEAGRMPMTFGLLRSAIFMPSDVWQWSDERRRIVLLHELAHVRRGDVATHWLARMALTVYWWNPLAWMAWREFLKERERATDDLVLAAALL
jgi:beta-lactamase regulating signal transducer with metallopeptidase domain